ncbi:MAG: DPP IV N-terminal domain-containing protein [Muribaculaceae bacterium]|nr:DPP IV N-terminal domain-containing protein [Muribaculaceae bacterium]
MKRLTNILLASCAAACTAVPALALTPEDYCDPKITAPAAITAMRPLADGSTYAAISADKSSIEVFSYRTGKKTGVLFSLSGVKGDVKIDSFDGYTVSGNGKKILLWNNVEKIYRHSFTADYYVYDVARETLKRVSDGGRQRGATLSHDGRMVAYTRDNNIYISNLDYGTDNAITTDGKVNEIIYGTPDWGYEEEFGVVNTMRWSGDDNTLVFMRFDESKVPTYSFDAYKSYCEDGADEDLYPARYNYKYPLAGYPNSVVSLYAYDLNNRTTKKMDLPLKETDYIPSVEFAGERVMAMVLNRDQNHLTLYSVNPGSTVAKAILTEKSEAWLAPDAYQMVSYEKDYFVIGSERSGYRHLYKYSYAGSLIGAITKGDFNVTAFYGVDAKGNTYVQCTKLGAVCRNVARVDRKGGMTLLHDRTGFESASFSSDFSFYVRTYSNASTPTQYTLWTAGGSKVADLQLNEEYAAKYASAPKKELLKVKNAAGQEMNAYIIKPVDFDPSKKYPLVTYQYNGPDSQQVLDRWSMEGVYYLAAQGYIVACVDGRGTGNRSREWANCVYKRLGKYETEDQIAGARYFASLPYVDASRMACFGWSYGGYMTLMELTAADTPFKAGVAMAPVTDWRYYDSIYTERYMLTPQQNEAGYNEASAMLRTKNLKSKLLIMSGTSDDNVHFYNTVKYVSKLNAEGTLCDMMAYAGFEHSLPMCNARTMLFRKIASFLDKNL